LHLARLALIVAAFSRCGGLRGGLARRRRRGPAGPKSGRRLPGAQRFPRGPLATGGSCAAPWSAPPSGRAAISGGQPVPARSARPLLGVWADIGAAPGNGEDGVPIAEDSTVRSTASRPTPHSCWSCLTDGSGPVRHSPWSPSGHHGLRSDHLGFGEEQMITRGPAEPRPA
jgi:hypothetical protein